MPQYLAQFAYSPEAWAALSRKPEDRSEAVTGLLKKLGGHLIGLYYHFGEYDGTVIFEVPDDTTANAFIVAAVSAGHLKATRTTRLINVHEAMEAMRLAGKASYRPPQGME